MLISVSVIGLVCGPRVPRCLLIGETLYMHVPAYQKTMIAVKQETTRTLQNLQCYSLEC